MAVVQKRHHFRCPGLIENVFLISGIVFTMLSTSSSFYLCFSPPGFSLEYTLHIMAILSVRADFRQAQHSVSADKWAWRFYVP